MSLPLAAEAAEAAWAALPTNKKLAVAAKAGMWAEFIGERAYNFVKPKVKKAFSHKSKKGKKTSKMVKRKPSSLKKPADAKRVKKSKMKENKRLDGWGYLPGMYHNAKVAAPNTVVPILGSTNSLYSYSMSTLDKTSTNNISGRQRDVVNIKGVKFVFNLHNLSQDTALQINYAVIIPKNNRVLTNGSTSVGDFFRNEYSTSERSTDFNTSVIGRDKHTLPINADEFYVLTHKKYTVNPERLGAGDPSFSWNKPNYLMDEMYIPINKQVRYNDLDNEPERGRIYFVMWTSGFQLDGTAVADQFKFELRTNVFFTEVGSY